MALKIADTRVVITGAGSGIGRETALQFARRGAEVAAVDLDGETAAATARECLALGHDASSHACDVSDPAAVTALAERIERECGPVDVMVANAGVGLAGPFLDNSIEDWRWLLSVNLDGVAFCCHAFAGPMVQRGRGHLVNIASMAGFMPHGSMAAYCTSKAAVVMLSQCLRADLGPQGVGVSAVCPGVINTPIPHNTRYVGSMVGKRDRAVRAFRHGHSPDAVAKAIVGAVERNREVVPVGVESSVAYRLLRFAPAPARQLLARIPLG